jgi:hypothetical protein
MRQNKDNKDKAAQAGIQQWHKKMKDTLADARQKYEKDAEVTQLKQKKQATTLKDLAELIEDTVDEIIGAVRKEKTNFDNAWLPTHEVELDSQASFVKYVGYNTVVVQDIKFQVYFFTGDELLLQKKSPQKNKLQDAFGNRKYICMALDQRNVQFIDR